MSATGNAPLLGDFIHRRHPVAPATVGAAAEAGRYAVVEIGAVEGVAILKPVYRVDLLTRNAIPPDFE
jgi:hypothetical protein